MPVNKHLARNLKKEYGDKEGEKVYFAMENSKGKTGAAYKKGLKTATKEGHTVAHMKTLRKKPKKKPSGRKKA